MKEYNLKLEDKLEKLTKELLAVKNAQLVNFDRFDTFMSSSETNGSGLIESSNSEMDLIAVDINEYLEKVYPKLPKMQKFFIYSSLFLCNTDTLSIKVKRTSFVRKFTDFDLGEIKENESEIKYMSRSYFNFGGNTGSLGAIRSHLNRLGILKSFMDKNEQDKADLLSKAQLEISIEYKEFLNQLVD